MADINFPKEYLAEALEAVDTLDGEKAQLKQLTDEKRKAEKELENLTRSMEKDKNDTVRTRRAEVEKGYQGQLQEADREISAINGRRQKARQEMVNARVEENTAGLKVEIENLKTELKEYIQAAKLPGVFASRAFYTIFSPMNVTDWIINLAIAAICIGTVIWAYVKQLSLGAFLGIFLGVVLLLVIYFAISARTKDKYPEGFFRCKSILKEIGFKQKNVQDITSEIRKDKDDSPYDLSEYDRELQVCSQKKDEISAAMTEALHQFDSETQPALIREIEEGYAERLGALQERVASGERGVTELTQRVKEGEQKLNSDYMQQLGTRNLTRSRISKMMTMIENGEAESVQEAASKVK